MAARSARQAGDRPFYAAYGWAYITFWLSLTPSSHRANMVSAALDSAGIAAPARILDAGCGTGRHAARAFHTVRVGNDKKRSQAEAFWKERVSRPWPATSLQGVRGPESRRRRSSACHRPV